MSNKKFELAVIGAGPAGMMAAIRAAECGAQGFLLKDASPEDLREAILKVARDEGPDLVVSLHSHESAPALLRPAYVPLEVQQDLRTLAEECYALLDKRNLPHDSPFEARPESGKHPSAFNLTSALYHICGASSFTFECPHGIQGNCQVTLEQILDIQLTLCEAMLQQELDKKK